MEHVVTQETIQAYENERNKHRFSSTLIMILHGVVGSMLICIPGGILPQIMAETGWDATQAGMLSGINSLAIGIALLIGTRVFDFLGFKKTAQLSALIEIIGCVLAFTSGNNYSMQLVSRAVLGVGIGFGMMLHAPCTSAYFYGKNESFWQGFRMVFIMLSLGIDFYFIVPLYNAIGSWYVVAGLFGILPVISLILLTAIFKNPPINPERPPVAAVKTNFRNSGIAQAMRSWQTWIYVIGFTATLWMFNTYSTYLPTFLQFERGWEAGPSSMLTGLISWMGIISAFLAGIIIQKSGRVQSCGWPTFVICIAGILLTCLPENGFLIGLGVCLCGFGNSLYNPVYPTALSQVPWANENYTTASIAMVFGVGYLVTYFVPEIFGAMYKNGAGMPISTIWLIFGIALIIGLVPQFTALETGPKGNLAKQQKEDK